MGKKYVTEKKGYFWNLDLKKCDCEFLFQKFQHLIILFKVGGRC